MRRGLKYFSSRLSATSFYTRGYNHVATYEGSNPSIQEVYSDIENIYLYKKNDIDIYILLVNYTDKNENYFLYPDNNDIPDNKLIDNIVSLYCNQLNK